MTGPVMADPDVAEGDADAGVDMDSDVDTGPALHSPTLAQLAAALVAAQAELPAVPKNATNPFYRSRYPTLAAVVNSAAPVLSRHGLAVTQWVSHDGNRTLLRTYLLHSSGEWISDAMPLHLAKLDPQAQGSAVTYARRYSYMAVLGIVGEGDDDDAEAAVRRPQIAPESDSGFPPPRSSPGRDALAADDFALVAMRTRLAGLDPAIRSAVRDGWQWGSIRAGADKPLTAADLDAAWQWVVDTEAATYGHRRRHVMARLGEVGIRTDEGRHALVHEATGGAVTSTASLTASQYDQVLGRIDLCASEDSQ